ncbi:MAG: hypothetical protein AAF152_00735 [Cyanobacteria bacterium P01_A01_bin.114]
MPSSPLHLTSHTHYYRGGEVTIDPSAAIASGVVLQALPGAAIHIGPHACLGAGVVIQAKGGTVVVESGASLGTSVLIVGYGRIGSAACVGPASTLLNPQVDPHAVIPPNSLLGDRSRSAKGAPSPGWSGRGVTASVTASISTASVSSSGQFSKPSSGPSPGPSPVTPPRSVAPRPVDIPDIPPAATAYSQPSVEATNGRAPGANGENYASVSALTVNGAARVYGRDQVDTLLSALFPHRQPLNSPSHSDRSDQS